MTFPLVYLAGPMHGLSQEEAVGWRKQVTLALWKVDVHTLSPVRRYPHIKTFDSLREPTTMHETPKAITTGDRLDVQRSNVVLMNLLKAPRASIGSCVEVGWADIYRKPLVVVAEPNGNPHDHPMIRNIAAYWLPDLDDGIAAVKALLGV